jgi:hypothetical protein
MFFLCCVYQPKGNLGLLKIAVLTGALAIKGSSILVKENDNHAAAANLLAFDLDQSERLRYVSKSGRTLL